MTETTSDQSATIVVGVCGGVAAYKTCELVRLFKEAGWAVSVVLTDEAEAFVSPLTFAALSGQPVSCSRDWVAAAGRADPMVHITLAQAADVFVIAPATAQMLAKLAHGFADDLVCCIALATRAPVIVAPAMNDAMWDHPAVAANTAVLKQRGVTVLDPEHGQLACGAIGTGRMVSPLTIKAAVDNILSTSKDRS